MKEPAADALQAARQDVRTAIGLSRQGSYNRRAPSPESLPHYGEAKRLLQLVLEIEPNHREALVLMAQVFEGLMDFDAAADFLNRAIRAGEPKTKKLRRKLALMHENTRQWKDLVLAPHMLRDLGQHLESMGVDPANRSLDFTREWLSSNFDGDPEQVIGVLNERGAFSDFHVLVNVVHG